ncbi:nucleoside deaminase [Streptomyces sp. NPDC088560]|uniref:nucleoside deaminase n=1 Tax=Streptomyces sp. NPDC088560 TaxID=3365868 RepID=UPI00380EE5F8
MVKDSELGHLRRCVELAVEALENGDEPFGSVLVAADGTVPAEDRNRMAGGDHTRHPEFELARWSAAHARVRLGRIVYVASSAQLTAWSAESGAPQAPVRPLPVQEVAPGVAVEGPVPELADEVRELHRRRLRS